MSTTATTIDPEHRRLGEVEMVGRDRWRRYIVERVRTRCWPRTPPHRFP